MYSVLDVVKEAENNFWPQETQSHCLAHNKGMRQIEQKREFKTVKKHSSEKKKKEERGGK